MRNGRGERRRAWSSVAVIGVVAVLAASCAKKDTNTGANTTTPSTASSASAACQAALSATDTGVPITYQAAKDGGCADKLTWPASCDTTTGLIKIPINGSIPCVPAPKSANNGGATTPGVTATTIKVGYYIAPPDPTGDALLRAVGAYDSPAQVEATTKNFVAEFNAVAETFGRKVEAVKIEGTGLSTDEAAARQDAIKAKELGVFAVIGGPAQAKSFSAELAADHILCVGSCVIAQPEAYYQQNSPYLWPVGPSPDESAAMSVEFVKKQLAGHDAVWAGNPAYTKQKRTFALLTYDTADGQYASSWNTFEKNLKAAVGPANYKGRVTYFLNVATAPQDGKTIARQLSALGATTVVFTGDPLEPIYFTKEATAQGYFPEWVLAGTVYADTAVFGRKFDPQQWKHAFGESLIASRIPREQTDPVSEYRWATGHDPEAVNGVAIYEANVRLLFTGIQLAGAKLTPESFRAGIFSAPLTPDPSGLRDTVSFGDHGLWPNGTDYSGIDDYAIVWWNPTAKGQDETGAPGSGLYETVQDGKRILIGKMPTTPLGLFDKQGSVAYFDDGTTGCDACLPVPAALKWTGPTYPSPKLGG